MKVILDANFLMAATQFKVDIFRQLKGYKLYTTSNVLNELKKLDKGRTKTATAAKISLQLVKTKHLKVLNSKEQSTDKELVNYSKKGYIIATQDIILRKRVKKAKGKAIYIRQKKYVNIE